MESNILSMITDSERVTEALLLLLGVTKNSKDDLSKYLTQKYRDIYEKLTFKNQANELLELIHNDQFENEIFKDNKVQKYIEDLEILKNEILSFYFTTMVEKSGQFEYFPDAYSKISEYLIQLKRLRLVIQPEFQFASSTHTVSDIKYLTVRGFWINDAGERERKFVKSIGRADLYAKGKDDPEARKQAKMKLREVLIQEYAEKYP